MFAPGANEIVGEHRAAVEIRADDLVAGGAVHVPVDAGDRHAGFERDRHRRRLLPGGSEHETVDELLADGIDHALVAFGVGVPDDHAPAVRGQEIGEAQEDFRYDRVGHARDDDADRAAVSGFHRLGKHVRLVAQILHDLQDLVAGLRLDLRTAGKHPGYGCLRNAGASGDVAAVQRLCIRIHL